MESSDTFAPEGAEERERIRVALDESALALQRDRIAAETTGTGKVPTLAERIHALGFEDEAERIFDLLPLVHVAWADGKIQNDERAMILNVLQIRSMATGKAFTTLEALLEKKPSQAYLEESLAVLKDLVSGDATRSKTIVGLCVKVAEAAGGFLGIRPISSDERTLIERIAKELGDEAIAEFNRQLG
jgi:tellurite resistance protein